MKDRFKDVSKPIFTHDFRQNAIEQQRVIEDTFTKAVADRSSPNLQRLYFKGAYEAPGRRIMPYKDIASNERVFGLDTKLPYHELAKIPPIPNPGKRQHRQSSFSPDLISGGYGQAKLEKWEKNIKPYN